MMVTTSYAPASSPMVPSQGLTPARRTSALSAVTSATRCPPAEWPISTTRLPSPPQRAAFRCTYASARATSSASAVTSTSGTIR